MQMSTKIVFSAFCLFAVFNAVLALNCYASSGSKSSDCALGKKSAKVIEPCLNVNYTGAYEFERKVPHGIPNPYIKVFCIKVVLSSYDPNLVDMSCDRLPSDFPPCTYLKETQPIEDCYSCDTDSCNYQEEEEPKLYVKTRMCCSNEMM